MKISNYKMQEQEIDQGLPIERPNRLRTFPGISGNSNATISISGYERIDWRSDNDAARMFLNSLLAKYFGSNVVGVVSELFGKFSSLVQIVSAPAQALKSSLKGEFDALVTLATVRNLQTHILHSKLSSQPYIHDEKSLFEYLSMRLSNETACGVYALFLNQKQMLLHDCYFEDDGQISKTIYQSVLAAKASNIIIGYKQKVAATDSASKATCGSGNDQLAAQLKCGELSPYLREQILVGETECYRFGSQIPD